MEEFELDVTYRINERLIKSIAENKEEVVQFLISKGADVNWKDTKGFTPLMYAVCKQFDGVVKILLNHQANITLCNNEQSDALILAAMNGNANIVKMLLDKNANVTTKNKYGADALYVASRQGHADVVKIMLERGADIHSKNCKGFDSLIAASSRGHIHTVRLLLKKHANILSKNNAGNDALIEASHEGHSHIVECLLQNNANVNSVNHEGVDSLMAASISGHLYSVKLLLKHNANVLSTDNKGNNALMLAAEADHPDVVKLLLESNVNINLKNNAGSTALMCAISKRRLLVVELLLQHKADISCVNKQGNNALDVASLAGLNEIVQLLLRNNSSIDRKINEGLDTQMSAAAMGLTSTVNIASTYDADVSSVNRHENSSLHLAAQNGQKETVNILLRSGLKINSKNSEENTPLMCAASNGHISTVELLLMNKADINCVNKLGYSALNLTSFYGNTQMVELLLKHKAAINSRCNLGWSPLMSAASNGHVSTVQLLLNNNAEVSAANQHGNNALILASLGGHTDIVETLIQKNIDINYKNRKGCTSLMEAASKGHLFTVQLLLKNKAEVSSTNQDGNNALILSSLGGHTDIVEILLQNKADINSKNRKGENALMSATSMGHLSTVQLLLKYNANTSDVNNEGSTALMVASASGKTEIVKLFLQNKTDVLSRNNSGNDALNLASEAGHINIVALLLQSNADINSRNHLGRTCFHSADIGGHASVTELLLKYKTNRLTKDSQGKYIVKTSTNNEYTKMLNAFLHDKVIPAEKTKLYTGYRKHLCCVKDFLKESNELDIELHLNLNSIIFNEKINIPTVFGEHQIKVKSNFAQIHVVYAEKFTRSLEILKSLSIKVKNEVQPTDQLIANLKIVLSEFSETRDFDLMTFFLFQRCLYLISKRVNYKSFKNKVKIGNILANSNYSEYTVTCLREQHVLDLPAPYFINTILATFNCFSDVNETFCKSLAQLNLDNIIIPFLARILTREINEDLKNFTQLSVNLLFKLNSFEQVHLNETDIQQMLSVLASLEDKEIEIHIKILLSLKASDGKLFTPMEENFKLVLMWKERATQCREGFFQGYSSKSLTVILEKFCLIMQTSVEILAAAPFKCFIDMLNSGIHQELISACNCLVLIARKLTKKTELRNNTLLFNTLVQLQNCDDESIRMKIKSVLWLVNKQAIITQNEKEIISPEVPENWEKSDPIGIGACGSIYMIHDKQEQDPLKKKQYVVKEVILQGAEENNTRVLSELNILMKIEHERIVRFHGFRITDSYLHLIFDFMQSLSLDRFVKQSSNSNSKLPEQTVRIFTRQILEGVNYLHRFDPPIVHRDIKGQNILVENSNSVKLADFGVSKLVHKGTTAKSFVGTSKWMAPEVIQAGIILDKPYDLKADIWSLACTVIEMATGDQPFPKFSASSYFIHISNGNTPEYTLPNNFETNDIKDFIDKCLHINPSERPSALELLQHPLVSLD